MAFGFSFGKSSGKSAQTTNVDKLETTNQTQNGTQSTKGTTTNTGTTTQQGQTTGTQTQATTGATTNTGATTGVTQQTTSQFDAQTLDQLKSAVSSLFGSVSGPKTQVGNFNADEFVSGGMAKARADSTLALEDNLNQMTSAIGGRADGNSMAALLANRARSDNAATLAGTEAQLTAQANEIVRNNALAGSQIDSQSQAFLSNLLQSLRGGETTTTGTEQQQTNQSGTTTGTGTTTSAENSTQSGTTASTQVQDLVETIQSLLSGTSHVVGTESTKGTQSKSGGGFSLSM
jgi:putative membrane protein